MQYSSLFNSKEGAGSKEHSQTGVASQSFLSSANLHGCPFKALGLNKKVTAPLEATKHNFRANLKRYLSD